MKSNLYINDLRLYLQDIPGAQHLVAQIVVVAVVLLVVAHLVNRKRHVPHCFNQSASRMLSFLLAVEGDLTQGDKSQGDQSIIGISA